jgi:hypothetical protein
METDGLSWDPKRNCETGSPPGHLCRELHPAVAAIRRAYRAHHYAYVVENIEATVKRLAEQLGAGPFFLVENVPLENITSRGEPAEFVHHSAFGYGGGGPIELMEIVRLVPERDRGPLLSDRGFITSPGRYRRHQ